MAAELLSGATLPIMSFSAAPIFVGSLVVTAGYTGAAGDRRRSVGLHRERIRSVLICPN